VDSLPDREDHPENSLPRSGQCPCDDAAKGVTSQLTHYTNMMTR